METNEIIFTHQIAPTEFVLPDNGIKYAYQLLSLPDGIPLFLHTHFRSNMDFSDPALIDTLGARRPVVLFDSGGVGKSTGEVPETFQGWADHLIAFVQALGLEQIDLLGYSMGGCAAQVALTAPHLIRKLILAGTMPSQGPVDIPARPEPIALLASAKVDEEFEIALAKSFYNWTDEGRAAAKVSWDRIQLRRHDRAPFLDLKSSAQQRAATSDWKQRNPNYSYDRLEELKMPVLTANGDNDLLIPTVHSWNMMDKIRNAQLIIYPEAGYGFLFQYAELFANHVHTFLDGHGMKASL
ncbi:alpha/beta-hydrolase [Patellaria atrata CBS 101060]|uniref:Alpha/beta-hydrolase n=1 Tax=Patellaria atrata CBS 101060 TaxID=1346257 RepID=A0A9P4S778_9PEZI|nr:alpha/beta-hydrolase [Patellaria atrata CBS 101060]